jgi:hypothetical protein
MPRSAANAAHREIFRSRRLRVEKGGKRSRRGPVENPCSGTPGAFGNCIAGGSHCAETALNEHRLIPLAVPQSNGWGSPSNPTKIQTLTPTQALISVTEVK